MITHLALPPIPGKGDVNIIRKCIYSKKRLHHLNGRGLDQCNNAIKSINRPFLNNLEEKKLATENAINLFLQLVIFSTGFLAVKLS